MAEKQMSIPTVENESDVIIEINDTRILARYPNGNLLKANWNDLESIEIHTNDHGPIEPDVWFIITSSTGQCIYPQGASGEEAALKYILSIEGLNLEMFQDAMFCTENAEFVCWRNNRLSQ